MNVSEALARLTGLLEDMDAMNARSISSIEEKLGEAGVALEEAKSLRELAGAASAEGKARDAALEAEIAAYKNRILELEEMVEAAGDNVNAEIRELTSSNESLSARIADLESALLEKSGLEDRIQELGLEIGDRDLLLESLRSELSLAQEKAARADELEGITVERDALHAELDERDTRLEHLQTQMEELCRDAGRVQELEQALQEREENARSLEEKVTGLQQDRQEKESALEAACADLKSSLEQAARDLETLREEHRARCEELDAHKAGHETALSEIDILRIDHRAIADELEEHKSQMAKVREQLQAMESERAAVESQMREIDSVKESQAKVTLLLQQREAQVQALEQALNNADEHRGKLELQTKMLLGQIEDLQYHQQDLDVLKNEVARLEGELEKERSMVVRLKAQLSSPAPLQAKLAGNDSDFLLPAAETPDDTPKKVSFDFEKNRRGQRKRIGEILIEADVITDEQLKEALRLKSVDPRRRVGSVLIELGYATEEVVAAALAAQLRMRYVENVQQELDPGVLQFVPSHIARNHRCVPLSLNGGTLVVAMANPLDLIAIEDIEIASNARVEPVVSPPTEIDAAIARYYQRDAVAASRQ